MWPLKAPIPHADRHADWPELTDHNHLVESARTRTYNCIAWAYGLSDRRLWPGNPPPPGYTWPGDVTGADEFDMLKSLYVKDGYSECDGGAREEGYEKVAIYVNANGPQHAALQLESGQWTSKLGGLEDIHHNTAEVLQGDFYGYPTAFLKRRRDQEEARPQI